MKWTVTLSRLLWFDGLSGLLAGIGLLLLGPMFSKWLDLPYGLLIFQGYTNLVYATYALALARRKLRSMWMLRVLALANLGYAVLSLVMLIVFFNTCNAFGKMLFVAEILYIGGLGLIERDFFNSMRDKSAN